MGKLIPIVKHVNDSIKRFVATEKPEWAAPDEVKRAINYSQNYQKNHATLVMLYNSSPADREREAASVPREQ